MMISTKNKKDKRTLELHEAKIEVKLSKSNIINTKSVGEDEILRNEIDVMIQESIVKTIQDHIHRSIRWCNNQNT